MKTRYATLFLVVVLLLQISLPSSLDSASANDEAALSFDDIKNMIGGITDSSQITQNEDGSITITGLGSDNDGVASTPDSPEKTSNNASTDSNNNSALTTVYDNAAPVDSSASAESLAVTDLPLSYQPETDDNSAYANSSYETAITSEVNTELEMGSDTVETLGASLTVANTTINDGDVISSELVIKDQKNITWTINGPGTLTFNEKVLVHTNSSLTIKFSDDAIAKYANGTYTSPMTFKRGSNYTDTFFEVIGTLTIQGLVYGDGNRSICLDGDCVNTDGSVKRTVDNRLVVVGQNGNATIDNTVVTNNVTNKHHGAGISVVSDTSSHHPSLTLNNTVISNCTVNNEAVIGNELGIHGGGLYLIYGTVRMNDSKITNCYASNYGGGIFVSDTGTLYLNNSEISHCSAKAGGAVFVAGKQSIGSFPLVSIADSKIEYNEARISFEGGGGLYLRDYNLNLSNSSVNYNYAVGKGGGIYFHNGNGGSTSEVTDTTIKGNISQSNGGGVYSYNANFHFENVVVEDNRAGYDSDMTATTTPRDGGGIHIDNSTLGEVRIVSTTINGNSSTNVGGGIAIKGDAYGEAIRITDSNIYGNQTKAYGGGVDYQSDEKLRNIILTNCQIYSNQTTNAYEAFGGGIALRGNGTFDVNNCKIYSNSSAQNGGGIAVNKGTLTIAGSHIYSNSSTANGGGIYQGNAAALTVTNCLIGLDAEESPFPNTALNGGGICVASTANTTITNTRIENNTASSNGGGIHADSAGGSVTIGSTSTLKNNDSASGNGGGVFVSGNTSFAIDDTQLSGNTAIGNGGAVSVSGYSSLIVGQASQETVTITNNSATNGGGVYFNSASASSAISNATINSNTATANGGGIYCGNSGVLTLNSTIQIGDVGMPNSAQSGGGIYVDNTAILIADGTHVKYNTATNGGGIYSNSASAGSAVSNAEIESNAAIDGGGLYIKNGTFTVSNSYINSNNASNAGGGIFNDGTLILNGNTEVNNNSAEEKGGGIVNLCRNGEGLTLNNATIQYNTCVSAVSSEATPGDYNSDNYFYATVTGGGGIFTGQVNGFINVQGTVIVKDNTAGEIACNVLQSSYSTSNAQFRVTGPLTNNSYLGVYTYDVTTKRLIAVGADGYTLTCTENQRRATSYNVGDVAYADVSFFYCDRDTLFTSRHKLYEGGKLWFTDELEQLSYYSMDGSEKYTDLPTQFSSHATPDGNNLTVGYTLQNKEGYTFLGWSITPNSETADYQYGQNIVLTETDTRLYAVWNIMYYTVTFDGNGGTIADGCNEQKKAHGTTILIGIINDTQYADPTYTDRRFIGWNTKADGTGKSYAYGDEYFTNADLILYAQWEGTYVYEITYIYRTNLDPSVSPDSSNFTETFKNTSPTHQVVFPTQSATCKGYTFLGWSNVENGTLIDPPILNGNANETVKVTYYAVWKEIQVTIEYVIYENEYKDYATLSSDGEYTGTVLSIGALTGDPQGTTVTLNDANYEVGGWYNQDDVSVGTGIFFRPSRNEDGLYESQTYYVTIIPNGKYSFTLNFHANADDVVSLPADVGPVFSQSNTYTFTWAANPTRSGHIFLGWSTTPAEGEATPITFKATEYTVAATDTATDDGAIEATADLYAIWAYATGEIIITPETDIPDQRFIYKISGDNGIELEVSKLWDSSTDELRIVELPIGTYTVSHDSNWAWRYGTTELTPTTVTIGTVRHDDSYGTSSSPSASISFSAEKTHDKWLDYSYLVKNSITMIECSLQVTDTDTEISSIAITNTCETPIYVRLKFSTYWVNAKGNIVAAFDAQMPSFNYDTSKWICLGEDIYCYNTPLAADANVELLSSTITLPTKQNGYTQRIEVYAEAIQALPTTAVEEAWNVNVGTDGTLS